MIGSIVGTALKVGGSIFGGYKRARAMRKAQKQINNQKEENQDWFDRRYNEDATQRADAQRLLTMTAERIKNRNKQIAGTSAVMGSTNETAAAERAQNNEAMADTMSRIAASAADRKDQIEGQFQQREDALNQQLYNMQVGEANAIADATRGVSDAAAGIVGSWVDKEEEK